MCISLLSTIAALSNTALVRVRRRSTTITPKPINNRTLLQYSQRHPHSLLTLPRPPEIAGNTAECLLLNPKGLGVLCVGVAEDQASAWTVQDGLLLHKPTIVRPQLTFDKASTSIVPDGVLSYDQILQIILRAVPHLIDMAPGTTSACSPALNHLLLICSTVETLQPDRLKSRHRG